MPLSILKNNLFNFSVLMVTSILFSNIVNAQAWPEGAINITPQDFVERHGQLWRCDLQSGHDSFENLGREYYFEDTANGDDSIGGVLHSVTLDRGTLIAQGFSIEDIKKGMVYLRRDYVMDDGVDFPQFVGDAVSIPMKVSPNGEHMYPGTFKIVDDEFVVGILDCIYDSDDNPSWIKQDEGL